MGRLLGKVSVRNIIRVLTQKQTVHVREYIRVIILLHWMNCLNEMSCEKKFLDSKPQIDDATF